MIKNKLYPYIEKYINEFLWGFSKEQLNVGVINGTIVLEKLNIRIDQVNKKLDANDTPFWMKSGTINKIQVCCSLMNFIGEKPLEITIDNIDIILCPSAKWILRNLNSFIQENDSHLKESYDPIDNNFHDIFAKRVNIYDGSILKKKAKLIEFFKDKSKIAEILNKFLNVGLKYYYQKSYLINLKIKNIHFRFEDDLHYHMFLKPGLSEKIGNIPGLNKNKIAMGLTIQDFEMNLSADGNAKKNNFKVENLNVYYETKPEIYIPIKTFFEHLDKDLVINEKYYDFLKSNLTDFNKIINNFHLANSSNTNANTQLRLQKNLYFQCSKIIENLNFMGNFGISSTDKGNIDFFSKTREKNYKLFIQIATSDIKIELNDFIINYVKNILDTMRANYLVDTIQEFKPMRKPYNTKELLVQKVLSDEKSSDIFNKKRKLVVRDWLNYMVWFSRFKKAIYGKLDNNLLQDEFSRYYNICCNNSQEPSGILSQLENMKAEKNAGAVGAKINGDLSAENNENSLKKDLNPEEINLCLTSDFLVKSITLKIHNAFDFDKNQIDFSNFHQQIKNETGLVFRVNSIDKKAFLSKEDFSLTFSVKNFLVDTVKHKISILKNLEDKIILKSKEMKAITGSAAVVYRKADNKINEIPRPEMASSNSKSSLSSANFNQVPNIKISMRPSNGNSISNSNNNNGNLDDLVQPFNNNNNNKLNYWDNNSAVNSITYENNDNFRHRKKLLAIDEVLENFGGVNSSHINSKYRDDESFMEPPPNSRNNIVHSIFFKDKNQLDNKRMGNIVDMLLEKEGSTQNTNHLNNNNKYNDKLSAFPNPSIYNDNRKEAYSKPNENRNTNNISAYQNNYFDSKINSVNNHNINNNNNITNNQNFRPSNAIKLVFNNQENYSNSSAQLLNNSKSTNNINLAANSNKDSLFSAELHSNTNTNPSSNNKLSLKLKASNPKSNVQYTNETVNLAQENIAYIQTDNAFNIKTHNFQQLFKSAENNHLFNSASSEMKHNEISKLNFFEISQINSDEKNKKASLCLEFSYHKKNNYSEKLDKRGKTAEEVSLINDRLCLSTGDIILNISNCTVREAKEIIGKLINVKNVNLQRIKNSNFIKNLGLEKDLYELRLSIMSKLEHEVNLTNKSQEPNLSRDNSKIDNFKLAYSNANRNEIINYLQHLKTEVEKVDKKVVKDPKCDYRIHKVFDFLKKKSFEMEVNVPGVNVFSYINSDNNPSYTDIVASSHSRKNEAIFNLISRSKVPKIHLYLFIQNDSFMFKFLEYEYEFYNKQDSLKFEFSEFIEIIKTKYELLKYPIESQFDSVIKHESDLSIKQQNKTSGYKSQKLPNVAEDKNKEFFSKTNASLNTPNKFTASNKNENNLFDKNFKNVVTPDSNLKHHSINNLNKKFPNEPNNNNNTNFLEESISNHINTTKKAIKHYPKIAENVRNENLNDSSDIQSVESSGFANINNNIGGINKIISKNISNNLNNNNSNAKNPQSSVLINKNEGKDFNYYNNYESINDSLNNTVKISGKENTYNSNTKKSNFNFEKESAKIQKDPKNIQNDAIKTKNPGKANDNEDDFFNSIRDLDENIIPNEASNDLYAHKRNNKNDLNNNNGEKVLSPKLQGKKDSIKAAAEENNPNRKLNNQVAGKSISNGNNNHNEINNNYTNTNNTVKSSDPSISKKSINNDNNNIKNNPYSNLNRQQDSLRNSGNDNLTKNSGTNVTEKNLDIMRNKTSSNNTTNFPKPSGANALSDKNLVYGSNKNSGNVEVKDNTSQKTISGSNVTNKKKEEINDILKQYKPNSKQTSQTKIASLKPKTKSIK